jgi:hypothetical protein
MHMGDKDLMDRISGMSRPPRLHLFGHFHLGGCTSSSSSPPQEALGSQQEGHVSKLEPLDLAAPMIVTRFVNAAIVDDAYRRTRTPIVQVMMV